MVTANTASHLGHNDWRLPNIKELESLVKIDAFSPAIDQTFFHWPYSGTYFWSSTTYTSGLSDAWVVYFGNGGTGASYKTNALRVRLVRGGQSFDLLMPQPPPPANVTAIPTLGEWTTLLLAGLLGLAGYGALRRRG